MYIKHIRIDDFRNLKVIDFNLGQYTTTISGHNATGKSTLLALLGHCAELRVYKPIIKSQFRCEWNEIIKSSEKNDIRSPNIGNISFIDLDTDGTEMAVETLNYRTTWQMHRDKKRFRLLPVRTINGSKSSHKVTWPTLYLGLSRLYPVGESNEIKIEKKDLSTWSDELKKAYHSILHQDEALIQRFESISISETGRKKAVGLETNEYDAQCNSAGQDNLGQIILAILSFQYLKDKMGSSWIGGLLLIDELDATLHPSSQVKLYDYICKKARGIGIQVAFTTHSLSLIEAICMRTKNNVGDGFNGHELIYLTSANGPVIKLPNPSYESIHYDLTVTMRSSEQWRRITVYAEDDEARWFLDRLIPEFSNRIKCPLIKLGSSQLLLLMKHDYHHFKTHIILLDGDVSAQEIGHLTTSLGRNAIPNIVRLPGVVSPEQLLFDYYLGLDAYHPLLSDPELISDGITKRIVREALLSDGEIGEKTKREVYKEQFNKFLSLMEKIYPYWVADNKDIVEAFTIAFVSGFNSAAKYNGIPEIVRATT